MTKQQEIKALYLSGKNITDIASICNVSRATVYRYKNRDLSEGIDWDTLALNQQRDETNIKQSEEQFILTLIQSFDEAFEDLKKLDSKKRLEILDRYASTYYRLKAPLQSDSKAISLKAVTKALNYIADLAKKSKNASVQNFLADNTDEILSKVLKV